MRPRVISNALSSQYNRKPRTLEKLKTTAHREPWRVCFASEGLFLFCLWRFGVVSRPLRFPRIPALPAVAHFSAVFLNDRVGYALAHRCRLIRRYQSPHTAIRASLFPAFVRDPYSDPTRAPRAPDSAKFSFFICQREAEPSPRRAEDCRSCEKPAKRSPGIVRASRRPLVSGKILDVVRRSARPQLTRLSISSLRQSPAPAALARARGAGADCATSPAPPCAAA